MKSKNHYMALMFCLFAGTCMLLVAGICAAEDINNYYYSGSGNNFKSIMYMEVDLGNSTAAYLNFNTKFENKPNDIANAFISKNISDKLMSRKNFSGTNTNWPNWDTESFDLSYFFNGTCCVGFYYETNESGISKGFWVDDIEITVDGVTIFSDDGVSGQSNWTFKGFIPDNDSDTKAPSIDSPDDITIEQDTTGRSITWTIIETHPSKYWVQRHSTEVNFTEFVVTPVDYENNSKITVPINTSVLGIWNYKIFANDTSDNNASDHVKITVTEKQNDDNDNRGGGGGGGGGGTSGEDFANILVSETERENVNKDSEVSYSFDQEGNIIRFINFTGKTSSGRIAAKIDTLKDTSTLVDQAPPGKVYKNMGIYVGNLGWANPNNIADLTISFYVDKPWINTYYIDISTIMLYRYSDGKWNPLETNLIDEDSDFLYFESKTPGFSQFAVTGNEASIAQSSEEDVVVRPTVIVEREEPVTERAPPEETTDIPGFTLMIGVTIMLLVMQLTCRK